MDIISTEKAPGAIGPYSQGFEVNGLVYTSGQIPVTKPSLRESKHRQNRAAGTWAPSWKQRAAVLIRYLRPPVSLRTWMILQPLTRCMQVILCPSRPGAVWL